MARILFCHWFWITLVSGDTRVFPSSFTLVRVSAGLLLSAAAEDESEVDCLEIDILQKVAMITFTGAGDGEERPQLRLAQDGSQQQRRPVRVRQQLREPREGGGG